MTTTRRAVAFDQYGGLRLDLPIDQVSANQAIDLLDVDWNGGVGDLRPRDGATKFNKTTTGETLKALWGGPGSLPLFAVWEKVEKGPVVKGALVTYGSTGTTGAMSAEFVPGSVCFAAMGTPAGSSVYAMTGESVFRYGPTAAWATPTATVDGVAGKAMPGGVYAAAWPAGGNRLVVANTGSTGGPAGAASSSSHVWFSEPGNAEGYESTAYVQLLPGDGEEIVGLTVFNGQVFVFKQTKFFVFYGISVDEEGRPIFNYREFTLPSPIAGGRGEGGSSRVATTPEGVYMVCSSGLYLTTGSTVALVSDALAPLESSRPLVGPAAATIGTQRWKSVRELVYMNHRVFLPMLSGGIMLVFDLRVREWLVWKAPSGSFAAWAGRNGSPGTELFMVSEGDIYRLDPEAATDPTVTMEPRWQSGFYDLGSADEKTVVEDKLWGAGEVAMTSFTDLRTAADTGYPVTVKCPSGGGQARSHKSSLSASMFSHKVSPAAGSRLQKIVRYVREGRTATTQTG